LAENQLTSQVKFEFKGQKSNSDLLNWYKEKSPEVFINVSSTEGVPVSIMEAMAHSIPAIATNVGGNGEIVTNESGMLLSANPEPMEIREAILKFVEMNPEDFNNCRTGAYQMWKGKYNAESNYKRLADQLHSLS
jgi:glycosyltransferase involved in cell wall biosynthesis